MAWLSLRAQRILLFERRIHIPVLKHFFQRRPYAEVGDVVGNRRKSVRNMLRDDDHVTHFYLAARVSHHRAGAGGAVENRGDFVVCAGTPAVDDGAAGDQGSGARYYDVPLGSIVLKDSVRTL